MSEVYLLYVGTTEKDVRQAVREGLDRAFCGTHSVADQVLVGDRQACQVTLYDPTPEKVQRLLGATLKETKLIAGRGNIDDVLNNHGLAFEEQNTPYTTEGTKYVQLRPIRSII